MLICQEDDSAIVIGHYVVKVTTFAVYFKKQPFVDCNAGLTHQNIMTEKFNESSFFPALCF